MKKTTIKVFSLLVLCLAVIWSCEKFESFADDADILSINIYNVDSANVSIVGQEIDVKNSNVRLFVKGKLDEFPLNLNVKFTTSTNSKIFREGDFETLNFNSLSDSVDMMVIAQSGLPKKWVIKLSDQRNNLAEVDKMNIKSHSPAEVILKDLPVTIYKSIRRMEIFVEDGLNHFPLTTENSLTLTPKATIIRENGNDITADENGTISQTFVFPTPQSTSSLLVRSEKGDTAVWTVAIRSKYSDEADILGFKINNYIPSNIVFGDIRIDHLNSEVVIGIADGVTDPNNFMVSISQPVFTLTAGTTIGNDYNGELNFESLTRVPQITLYSENGQQRIWKFRLEYKFGAQSVFEFFRIIQANPAEISVEKEGVIDAVNRTILLKVTKGVRKFPLTLAAEAQITAGGEIVDPLNKLYFKDIDSKNTIRVRSLNAAVSLWNVSLRDLESSQSSANAITKLNVVNVVPSGTVVTPLAKIDADKHEITLQIQKLLVENAGKAILAEVSLEISPDAYIVNNTHFTEEGGRYRGTLRFESLGSSNEIKIEAANGSGQVWKVILAYQPLTGNDIKDFQVKSHIPAEFKLGSFIELSQSQQTIEITVNDGLEHFPLTITPEITLSENARIVSANRYVFEKITDQIKIIVASESGQEKIWTLKLKNNVVKDDKNNIEAFQVTGTIPDVDVQGTVVDPSHKTVTVYVDKTSYPLILSANTTVSPSATVVLPFYSYRFENAQQTHLISVQAENGVIQDWKLLLSDASPASNQAEIVKAVPISVTPAYNNIGEAVINKNASTVAIGVYDGATYPMILEVAFNVSPGAKITNLNSDNNLNFSDKNTTNTLNVVAADGSVKVWTVSQKILSEPVKAFTLVSSEKVTGNTVNNIKQVQWNADRTIDVYGLVSGAVSNTLRLHFSAKVRYEIATARNTRTLGAASVYSETIDIPLNTLGANGGKIVVSAENGYTANYEIRFNFEIRTGSDLAQVTGFSLNQIRPLYIVAPDVVIDQAAHEIVLKTNYTSTFLPFTFLADIQTSPFSLVTGISNGQLIDIDRADKTVRFNVKSESGATNDTWTLRVQHDAAAPNTAADVESLIITSHLPADIKIGTPAVDKAAKLIQLDVLNWLKNQTLYLTARPILSANATCNLPGILSFTNPNGSISFQVVSESGRTENWTLKLNFTAGSDADVTAFTVKSHMPEELVLNPAIINKTLQEVSIPVVSNLQFPVRIRPEITVSQGATALNAPLEYVFNSLEDIKKLQVEAEDGLVKEWNIRLSYSFNDEADVVSMTAGTAPVSVNLGAINVNTAQQVIEVNINNWNGYNEFTMTPVITLSPGATATGLNSTLTFTKKTAEEIQFTVVAEDKTTKKTWIIRLVYGESNKTNLESMTIGSYTPSGVQLKTKGAIDNTTAVVYIDIDKWNGNKDLTINNYTFTTQDNAKTLNLPATLSFTKESKESLSFKVRAQDGVTERNWTIRLRYTEVSNAIVTAFNIASTNRPSVVLSTAQITDPTITVPVTQGVRDGFNSSYMIQANVVISENGTNRTQPVTMTFNSIDDQRTFLVTDEFGTKKTWTVQLANKASNKAEITGFTPQAFTSGSPDLKYWKHVQSGNSYKIYVTDIASKDKYGSGNWPTVTMSDGAIKVSDKAACNVDLKLAFNLKTSDLQKNIQVTADDGVTVNNYTIELEYCPQFENSNFSQWYVNGDKVYQPGVSGKGSFWVTANMEYSGAINDGTTPYSPNGARMYSKEVGVAGINKFAAGSTFLGTFRKPTSIGEATGNPTALTTFGVEFRGRPKAVRITCGYNKDNAVDQGEIWVAGNYSGHSEDRRTASTAYGEKWFGITNGMKTYDVPITYKSNAPLTMLAISLTSSYLGAEFKGSVGAEFVVTNIELIYE